jgi:tetratricopeptide (TPR) repeat protein
MVGPAMTRGAWVACVLALAACDHAPGATEDAAGREPAAARAAARLDAAAAAELDRLAEAVRRAPSDHPLADRYRELARQHGAAQRAVKWLEQLAADPATGREAAIHFQLGMAYVDVLQTASPVTKPGLAGRAHAAFDAALARDPNHWDARYGKALLHLRMPASFKQYPKAIEAFTDLLRRQTTLPTRPEFALTYVRLSEAYVLGGDQIRAAAVLRDGLGRFPAEPLLVTGLASLEQRRTQP